VAAKRDLADAFDLPPPKARTPIPDESAERFVEPAATPQPQPKKVKKSKLRREGPGERVNAYLPPELAEGLREIAFRERRSVSDALSEAVRQWIGRKRAKVQES
jgi:hypothetical protein